MLLTGYRAKLFELEGACMAFAAGIDHKRMGIVCGELLKYRREIPF